MAYKLTKYLLQTNLEPWQLGAYKTTYYKQTYLACERSCRAASRLKIQLTIDDDWRNFQELGRRLIRVRIRIGGREGDVLRGRRDLLHRHLSTFQSGIFFRLELLLLTLLKVITAYVIIQSM